MTFKEFRRAISGHQPVFPFAAKMALYQLGSKRVYITLSLAKSPPHYQASIYLGDLRTKGDALKAWEECFEDVFAMMAHDSFRGAFKGAKP